jgi:hypothetical protein
MGTGSLPAVERPGRGVDHPPAPSAEVKERVEVTLLPLWTFVACPRVNFTFTFIQDTKKQEKRGKTTEETFVCV